ncbi:ABC transporter ATP-binding protein [candidate division WWE3 bacterium RIFCSPHIGHO2_01_FULL_48_15]|uniref:ABC transporter ATP-binding protein n=1 Tax=candidate division WWE3 bacterium RIFCSPHIGHO2_01_FULL_48_15 TaxID=1802619 RepID=A0A1F4VC94_UNCKA|nr:MAG: ABC transporter ATP-binding protein [candidate division WWE3 bacterium RIFCSPHIGHO2_01_FULL_48_15]
MNIIELKNATKIYGKGTTQVTALASVNLSVARAEAVSIMGPSGSGKTTLLNLVGALDKPTSGQVLLGGEEISRIAESKLFRIRREKVGFIFQSFYLVPTLNALENVLLPTLPVGRNSFEKRAKELLAIVGLGERWHHKPGELSGGEQQRVAIARALINEPEIVLADEPTGNLDSKTGNEIINLLLKLNQEKRLTLVIVTHEEEIAKKANRHILLKDGRMVSRS